MDIVNSEGSDKNLDTEKVLNYLGEKEKIRTENIPVLDKTIEKIENIFQDLDPETFERKGNESMYGTLLELLRRYILPNVKFNAKHREVVEDVLQKIEEEYAHTEVLIENNVQLLTKYEESLANQRKCLVQPEHVSNILNTIPKDKEFIDLLLKHIATDINKLDGIMIQLMDKIDKFRSSHDEASVKLLANTRSERDKISKEKENFIVAREELKNGISFERTMEERNAVSNKYELYKREAAEMESLIKDIQEYINIKTRLSTARKLALESI